MLTLVRFIHNIRDNIILVDHVLWQRSAKIKYIKAILWWSKFLFQMILIIKDCFGINGHAFTLKQRRTKCVFRWIVFSWSPPCGWLTIKYARMLSTGALSVVAFYTQQ